jgi:hypothetical protein
VETDLGSVRQGVAVAQQSAPGGSFIGLATEHDLDTGNEAVHDRRDSGDGRDCADKWYRVYQAQHHPDPSQYDPSPKGPPAAPSKVSRIRRAVGTHAVKS